MHTNRSDVVKRGQLLTWLTIGYNSLEAVVALVAGMLAGSVALIGFGFDSVIELSSSGAGLYRLHKDRDRSARQKSERLTLRVVGVCFILLAGYVLWNGVSALLTRSEPSESPAGIVIAMASLVVMPALARGKRRVAAQLGSSALTAEAKQTEICFYLSAILLAGLALNAVLGWWWADPAAALAMVPLITVEGARALKGETPCADCCPPASESA